jgi:hypothetical protein
VEKQNFTVSHFIRYLNAFNDIFMAVASSFRLVSFQEFPPFDTETQMYMFGRSAWGIIKNDSSSDMKETLFPQFINTYTKSQHGQLNSHYERLIGLHHLFMAILFRYNTKQPDLYFREIASLVPDLRVNSNKHGNFMCVLD